eukprot:TRINITY_DN886_c0_g2_i1.p1 TRINITY_DN886_c0_g2~~TRINITY_DN886_c0_g2_i1.p1  ORF type:complete len:1502 (+),score=511.86 TRINITY_DN886_c0_g2_i1:313-4818(+)
MAANANNNNGSSRRDDDDELEVVEEIYEEEDEEEEDSSDDSEDEDVQHDDSEDEEEFTLNDEENVRHSGEQRKRLHKMGEPKPQLSDDDDDAFVDENDQDEDEDDEYGDDDEEDDLYGGGKPATHKATNKSSRKAAAAKPRSRAAYDDSEEEEEYSDFEVEEDSDFEASSDDEEEDDFVDDEDDEDFSIGTKKRRATTRTKATSKPKKEFDSFVRKPPAYKSKSQQYDSDDELDSDDSDYGSKKKKKNRGFKKRKRGGFFAGGDFDQKPSLRNRGDRKSYVDPDENEDLDDDERELIREQKRRAEAADEGGDVIETVLDSKVSEDGEELFLIKWKGYSHIHNTWNNYNFLKDFKGAKKLQNFLKRKAEEEAWLEVAPPEEIERMNVEKELKEQMLADWQVVDRVISVREGIQSDDNPTGGPEYLVKWKGLGYDSATWEVPEDINEYQSEIDEFLAREQRQACRPRHPPSKQRPKFNELKVQPAWLQGGQLRDYQLVGLNWLLCCWCNHTNGILADEMGLGKTVQTISFLGYLYKEMQVSFPFLVVVPLSTVSNWEREFKKWVPEMNVIVYTGNGPSREMIRNFEFYLTSARGAQTIKFDALITTYEIILKDAEFLGSIRWGYLAVDEAQRLKNNQSQLHAALQDFNTTDRMLITGTPLQNSIEELWSLLHFLVPEKFSSLTHFQDKYKEIKEEAQIAQLHRELQPHLLRRVKKDVEKSLPGKVELILRVDLTPVQKKYYQWILAHNLKELNKGAKGAATTLLNIVVDLKKCCNHVYLFEGAEDLNAEDVNKTLIESSGKLILLHKLLLRLKEGGHRVLIFSQMVRMLNILADYLRYNGFSFQRLDGSMSRDKRQQAMDHFNAEGSKDFCFLLSTRAGGLGINLSTADTVIIFDSDWNPQNDLQAESRAHRIGQKKVVHIYRLVTKGTVEETILERAKQKMVLDHLVIQSMDSTKLPTFGSNGSDLKKEELAAILKFGAEELFKEDDKKSSSIENVDLDEILARAERREESENSAPELLSAFKVANFSTNTGDENDNEYWNRVIPQPTSIESDLFQMLPRTRQTRLKNITNGDDVTERSAKKRAAAAAASGERQPKRVLRDASEIELSFLSKKETRALISAIRKFGDIENRIAEIAPQIGLDSKDPKKLQQTTSELIRACRSAIEIAHESDEADGPVTIMINEIPTNAVELVQRNDDMANLGNRIQKYGKKDSSQFRLSMNFKPVAWSCPWTIKDDSMLLVGVYKYGIGSWEAIRQDKNLGLTKKISASEGDGLPKAPQLQRRIEFLLKVIRVDQEKKDAPKRNGAPSPKKKSTKAKPAASTSKAAPAAAASSSSSSSSRSRSRGNPKEKEANDDYVPSKKPKTTPTKAKSGNSKPAAKKAPSTPTKSTAKNSSSSKKKTPSISKTQCAKHLEGVKKELQKFEKLGMADVSKEERLRKTKKYLLRIGDEINAVVTKAKAQDHNALAKDLWNYSSTFTATAGNGDSLRALYTQILKSMSNSSK